MSNLCVISYQLPISFLLKIILFQENDEVFNDGTRDHKAIVAAGIILLSGDLVLVSALKFTFCIRIKFNKAERGKYTTEIYRPVSKVSKTIQF